MKKILLISMMTLALAATAEAKKYGDAGCGLGTLVVGKDGSQILAATTNSTAWNQTFGITFGTSNCDEGSDRSAQSQLPQFIEVNRSALANDMARGQGETLAHVSH